MYRLGCARAAHGLDRRNHAGSSTALEVGLVFEQGLVVPAGGLQAWAEPNPAQPPVARLEAGVDIWVADRLGEWAHVRCSNGWSGWVDGRLLPTAAPPPPAQCRPEDSTRGRGPTAPSLRSPISQRACSSRSWRANRTAGPTSSAPTVGGAGAPGAGSWERLPVRRARRRRPARWTLPSASPCRRGGPRRSGVARRWCSHRAVGELSSLADRRTGV